MDNIDIIKRGHAFDLYGVMVAISKTLEEIEKLPEEDRAAEIKSMAMKFVDPIEVYTDAIEEKSIIDAVYMISRVAKNIIG